MIFRMINYNRQSITSAVKRYERGVIKRMDHNGNEYVASRIIQISTRNIRKCILHERTNCLTDIYFYLQPLIVVSAV